MSYGDAGLKFANSMPYLSKEYKTHIGPSFAGGAHFYACDREGLVGAVKRLTARRKPEIAGLDQELRENQYKNVGTNYHKKWARKFNFMLRKQDLPTDIEEARKEWAFKAHPKKAERVAGWIQRYVEGKTSGEAWLPRNRCVDYRCKPGEFLAENKYLRGTGSLGIGCALQSGYIMDHLKEIFKQPLRFRKQNGQSQFCVMGSEEEMTSMFKELLYSDKTHYKFFSDDACLGVNCVDGRLTANSDITSCDGSIFEPIFTLLQLAGNVEIWEDDWNAAFEALRADMRLVDPCDHKNKLVLKNDGQALFSGSTLTTLVNNLANTLIFQEFMKDWKEGLTKVETANLFENSAKNVGFIVRLDVCECAEDLQFLKVSPVFREDGELSCCVNLGAWMKGFGYVNGDMPGSARTPMIARAREFNSSVVKGRLKWGLHSFADSFKSLVINSSPIMESDKPFEGSSYRLSDESVCRRYRLPDAMYRDLLSHIHPGNIGCRIGCPAVRTILAKDYGFSDQVEPLVMVPHVKLVPSGK